MNNGIFGLPERQQTITENSLALDLSTRWNDRNKNLSAARLNILDINSGSNSTLFEAQIGGSSKFVMMKNGAFRVAESWVDAANWAGVELLPNGTLQTTRSNVGNYNTLTFGSANSTGINFLNWSFNVASSGCFIPNSSTFAWRSGTGLSAVDTFLYRDAANTIAQRNSTNAQALRLYNTYTDTSNYERAKVAWATNVLQIGTEAAGTGTARNLELQTGGTTRLAIDTTGNVGIGTSAPGYKLEVNGSFAATTKSFVIDHPTKPGMKLRHGSLEGPENGVYVRGRCTDGVIKLPDYWAGLVDPTSITVNLTAIGRSLMPSVERVEIDAIYLSSTDVDCFFIVYAERKDVAPLEVEY